MLDFVYTVVNKSMTFLMEPVSFTVARSALDEIAEVLTNKQ